MKKLFVGLRSSQAKGHHVVIETAFPRQQTFPFQEDRCTDFGENNTPSRKFGGSKRSLYIFTDPVICALQQQLIAFIIEVGNFEERVVTRLAPLKNERKTVSAVEHSEICKFPKLPLPIDESYR